MRRNALCALLVASAMLVPAAPAFAHQSPGPAPDVAVPMFVASSLAAIPPGFQVDPGRALEIAKSSPAMQAIHRRYHPLQYEVFVWIHNHYEVFFSYRGKLLADVLVGMNGQLGAVYTGPLIQGVYARGKYGDVFDSPWVLIPFGLMFLLPLVRLRGRSWLDLLDLAAVLLFFVSYGFFDHAHLEAGVWLAYPPLLYLLGRMLIRGFRPKRQRRRLHVALPTWLLIAGFLALVAGRIAVTLMPAHILDVGVASLIGANKIVHGQSLYFASLGHPDTYGPVAYLAYVPFELIWPGADWAYDPAARAAAIVFDLVTIGGLIRLGMQLRGGPEGRRLGLLLGWMWAACPFTVLGLVKSTNDGLVAMLLVLMLVALNSPLRRGFVLGLAAAAKFFPAILLPLLAIGRGDGQPAVTRKTLAGFAIAAGGAVALFLPPGGIQEMYNHTIGFQLSRPDIFSIWALHPGLAPLKIAVEAGVVVLAIAVALRPRGPRSTAQVSALAAALTIAVQLPALHWFYLYIVWFMPLVLIAVLAPETPESASPPTTLHSEGLEVAEAGRVLVGAG